MLDKRVIFAIRNYANQGYAKAKIAELLCLDRKTVGKYLLNPEQVRKKVTRSSLLDPFRVEISELLRRRYSAATPGQRLYRQDHHPP